VTITPRQHLEFGLSGDIPRFWFGGSPFRTRLFDAHSLLTPAGERFFISSVREFRDEITDPKLQADAKSFILQEGQHSLMHRLFNQHLQAQGIDAEAIEIRQQQAVEGQQRWMTKRWGIALTAAYEHLTTIFAGAVMEHSSHWSEADPRIFALYAWHSAEELEHKAVCFDVMQKVARVGYFMRITAMLIVTFAFQVQMGLMISQLLRADSPGRRGYLAQWRRGLGWMYGRGGFLRPQLSEYFAYFKPAFHPTDHGVKPGYQRWLNAFLQHGEPMAAAAAVIAGPQLA
jgi:predicted metal-dependent hydrolase